MCRRRRSHGRKLGIDQQDLRFTMSQNICECTGVQPYVVGVQNRPNHWRSQRAFKRFGNVRRNQRYRIPLRHPLLCKSRGQPLAAFGHFTPIPSYGPVHLRGQFRMHPLDPLENRDRRQGRVVGHAALRFWSCVDHSPVHSGIGVYG